MSQAFETPDYIRRDGRSIATPCLRVMAYWTPESSDMDTVAAIVALFMEHFGDAPAWMRYADKERDTKTVSASLETQDASLSWLQGHTGDEYMLRLNGSVDEETGQVGIPQLRMEGRSQAKVGNRITLEISVPAILLRRFQHVLQLRICLGA